MANNNRKRYYQDSKNMETFEIESCGDDDDSPCSSENDDNVIEEEEEVTAAGCSSVSASCNYQPLNIKRTKCKIRSINQEREMNLDRKTVLYGQTPNAVRLKQLQEMAILNGMSLVEFAKHVISGTTSDNLKLLQQFHTSSQPQLLPLFESLQQDLQGDLQFSETSHSCTERVQPIVSTSSAAMHNGNITENITGMQNSGSDENFDAFDKMYIASENESYSHLGTGYSEYATVPQCELFTSCNDDLKRNRKSRGKSSNKTVILETESDSSSDESSLNASVFGHSALVPVRSKESSLNIGSQLGNDISVSHNGAHEVDDLSVAQSSLSSNISQSVTRRESTNLSETSSDFTHVQKKDSSSLDSSAPLSVNKVIDSIFGKKNIRLEHNRLARNGNANKNSQRNENFDDFLDDLLFGNPSKKSVLQTSQNSNDRKYQNNDDRSKGKEVLSFGEVAVSSEVSGYQRQSNSNNKCAIPVTPRENSGSSTSEQCSASYNKFLDQLLFGRISSSLEFNNEQPMDISKSDYISPSTSKQPMRSAQNCRNSMLKDICEVGDKSNGTADSVAQKSHVSLTDRENPSTNGSNKDRNKILPSSLELQQSLWDGLDNSLEY